MQDEALALDDPRLYLNRELSTLEFNRRVLAQAADRLLPVLERLRFLTILSANLDEFFEIRVSGLVQGLVLGTSRTGPDGLTADVLLTRISTVAHELVQEQYRLLNEEILPALAEEGIQLRRRDEWSEPLRAWVARWFEDQALPVLSPVGLDPAHPFPNVLNKGLNFIVRVAGEDVFGRDSGLAVVQVPRCLPRILPVPPELSQVPHDFVLISSVIHANLHRLFHGLEVLQAHQFRVTRNADLGVDEEEVDDLLSAVKGELHGRQFGQAVRLEVSDSIGEEDANFLLERHRLDAEALYQVNGPVNLVRVGTLFGMLDRRDLKFPPFVPGQPARASAVRDPFALIRGGDVLLHHPYQSFSTVVDLLRRAAEDPDVLAIKQTVYRTDSDSPIVEALFRAANNNKAVTVVVELRARFDEANNIDMAQRLQEAGANVVYGIVGYKTHAKMLLIVRREGGSLRRYVHIGTGNYHAGTARAYTDFSYLTCDPVVGEDVHKLFLQLTGMSTGVTTERLIHAPFTMARRMIEHIGREAEEARAGRPSGVRARMNSLSDPAIIQALYAASQAGVPIELLVRGICRLRPGIEGVSGTIRVRSVVGRFLEHSRVFEFHNAGEPVVYIGSADWMERNLYRRVETSLHVTDPALSRRIRHEAFDVYLADNVQAWELLSDGSYVRVHPGRKKRVAAQQVLLRELGA